MFYWLMRYAQHFGKEFPLLAVQDKSEYEVQIIVMDCIARDEEYKTIENLNNKAASTVDTSVDSKTTHTDKANAKNGNKAKK